MIYINNNTDPQMVSIPRGTVLPSSSVTQYATEEYVDNAIAEAISGITTYEAGDNIQISGNVISVTGMPDTSEFVTSGEVQTQIDDSIPTSNTAFTNDANFVNSGEVQTQIDTAISGLSPYTAGTYIDITDNIISVTGLTGDSGEKFVELTMAEYTALTSYTEDTTYIITDAPAIDLDSLATTAEVATKADKVTVTANGSWGYLPKWNNQGIITGSSRVYEVSLPINNSNYFMVKSNSASLPSIYAPTAGGTAGQILQSNGAANAPVWSSFKMWFGTQTQYDAITTKDSSTIYFVKED